MPIPSASTSKQGSLQTSGREFKKMEVGKCQPLPEEPAPLTAPVLASHPAHLLLVVGASAPPCCQLRPGPVQGWGMSSGLQTPGEHETASSSHVLQQPPLCEVTSAWPGAGRQDTPCMQAVLLQTLPASRRRQGLRSSPATAYLQIEFHTCAPPEQAHRCCSSRPAPLHPRPTPPPRITLLAKLCPGAPGGLR